MDTPSIPEYTPTPEQVQQDIKALGDSVSLIEQLVAEGEHSEEIHSTISRNTRHIRIMLDKTYIQESDADLQVFEDAATLGEDFIAQ